MPSRRSLILGAAVGSVVPSLVRAESLLDLPGDPLSRHGLRAAEVWAQQGFNEMPGCRLVFASGSTHRWFTYQHLKRAGTTDDYAVAIEVAITDAKGQRFVSSHPVDGAGLMRNRDAIRQQAYQRMREMSFEPDEF